MYSGAASLTDGILTAKEGAIFEKIGYLKVK